MAWFGITPPEMARSTERQKAGAGHGFGSHEPLLLLLHYHSALTPWLVPLGDAWLSPCCHDSRLER